VLSNNASVGNLLPSYPSATAGAEANPFDDEEIVSAVGLQTAVVVPPRVSAPSTNPFDAFPRGEGGVETDDDDDIL
jgi:hypothetical protein